MYNYGYKETMTNENLKKVFELFNSTDYEFKYNVGYGRFYLDYQALNIDSFAEDFRNMISTEDNSLVVVQRIGEDKVYEIVNVLNSLTNDDIANLKQYALDMDKKFFSTFNSSYEYEDESIYAITRVVRIDGKLYQCLAAKRRIDKHFVLYTYDDALNLVNKSNLEYILEWQDAKKYFDDNFDNVKTLPMYVYKNDMLGDCTNRGISSRFNRIEVMGAYVRDGINIVEDIRNVLIIEEDIIMGNKKRVRAVPAYNHDKWYSFGGNYVSTSDSRFSFDYPIPIHDRVE